MLQVAVGRLRESWPDASIGVITADAEELVRLVPGVDAIPASGRYELIDRGPPLPSRRDHVLAAAEAIGTATATAERALGSRLGHDARDYLGALAGADLLVVSGRGGICDAFHHESMHLLDEVEAACDMGLTVVMMGQGLGPIEDDHLRRRARDVLPRVRLLALREGRASRALAVELGVPADRLAVTGDDALEQVVSSGAPGRGRTGLGVNMRIAGYATVDDADVDRVGRVLRSAAGRLSAEFVGVPISTYPEEADAATIERLVGPTAAGEVGSVEEAIRQAGRCRVLVTGSYHAGLFALAQGVPVVGLARSGYYVDKLNGLAHQFGTGMTVLSLDDPDLERELDAAVTAWWEAPDEDLEALPALARKQVADSREAWGRVPSLIERSAPPDAIRRRLTGAGPAMVVERLETRELDGAVERSALFRWPGAERRVAITMPAELAGDPADHSPFLPLALLPAMRRGDDVVVDGAVSERLLRGARQAANLYGAWAPELRQPSIEVAEERVLDIGDRGEIASFFSRGVDSTYSAAVPRSHPGPVDRLLFVRGLDPNLGEAVMNEEVRLAGRSAERLGLPLDVLSTNVHDLTRLFVSDWEDMAGAALAAIAIAAAGGLRAAIVPSSDSTLSLSPNGTSPVLEPLFSTEATEVVHDSTALGRVDKCLWLARNRRELLAELKVCYSEARSDNCGRCGKCLLTMATLRAAGQLEAARQFPDTVDLDALRESKLQFQPRIEFAALARDLDDGRDPELRDALLDALARPTWTYPGPPTRPDTPGFRARHNKLVVALVRDRQPWPPSGPAPAPPGLGLVRAIDARRGRHVYGVGRVPPGEVAGELGSLPRDHTEGLDPVYLDSAGHLLTESAARARPRRRALAAARWTAAPLAWHRSGIGLPARARGVGERVRWLLRRDQPAGGAPLARVASIHRHPAAGRLPLFSAIHPVTGDQLLATNAWEATDLGYGEALLLGYVDSQAPVTGRLGVEARTIPWAARFGRRVRH
jgi:colanic acid/amylovoran biosynthesis protein